MIRNSIGYLGLKPSQSVFKKSGNLGLVSDTYRHEDQGKVEVLTPKVLSSTPVSQTDPVVHTFMSFC